MAIRDQESVKWPYPLKPNAGNQEQYYHFHRSRGHTTEACRQLKEEIERLIRQGYLRQFIKNPIAREETVPTGGQDQQKQSTNNRQMVGEIETIAGGPSTPCQVLIAENKEPPTKKLHVDHSITFKESDLEGVKTPHQDPLVISAGIGDPCYNVKRILVDNGSSVDVLFYSTFLSMGLSREKLQPAAGPLYGFDNRPVRVEGTITLPVVLGEFPRQVEHPIMFIVVKSESAYNAIFGRPLQTIFRAVASIPHLKLKFPTPSGIGTVRGDQQVAQSCYLRQAQPHSSVTLSIEDFDLRNEDTPQRASPVEDLTCVSLSEEHPSRTVQIGSLLSDTEKKEYVDFLRTNQDVFAWSSADMPGINPEIIMHSLKINPPCKPVIQKKRNFALERQLAIEQEVDKLLKARFIREVHYPSWLANVVMVRKTNGTWRMCVDYTDLNKACPKDSFSLPRIDQLVDATSGHQMLSFMDAYSGYNQIQMDPADEEATSFQMDKGLYCYLVMPFGLKNAGATYQRLMNKVFKNLIGRTMEVYVDDMLVKSLEKSQHISDLEECFNLLRSYNMRLNPSKCAFGVTSGKFLGFMVTHRGIEANPEKIKALRDMLPPRNIKEVQRLNGRIAALSRFLARSGDKYLPFFKILRGARSSGFQWTDKCQEAFEQLRTYLASPPLLSKPIPGKILYMYMAVSSQAISSVLVRMDDSTQRPVYYISKVLSDVEMRYPLADKTALALVFSARKLRPYFQAHAIKVYTNLPLKNILQKPEASGRLIKWSIELGEFDIQFLPRPDIKSQVLADFLVECTSYTSEELHDVSPSSSCWTLYVDGASGSSGAGAGILLISPQKATLEYGLRLKFPATNNVAEYEALIAGLRLAIDCEVQDLVVHTDSQLVASQVEGEFDTHNPLLAQYCQIVKTLLAQIAKHQVIHILREQNARADSLSKLATSMTGDVFKRKFIEEIHFPSIQGSWVLQSIDELKEVSWIDPILALLQEGSLPEDPTMTVRLRRQAANFIVINGELYKRSFTGPYLKCLPPSEANYALREVHSGICGEHLGGRALAQKVLRQGFYWPTIKQDALEFVRKCNSCQLHANLTHLPAVEISTLQSP
ncbi:hypothetical protein KFK09_011128 [Dendrobium nobile]|uniref:RNase H type-1 domain-containing protein n=1 Tax=Dendrobium nobile TaxID=94219 RepID=A0A8T3BDM5_DENNO|nr:hypothetical protein KFK09_011128 [Dendrobium nobile]